MDKKINQLRLTVSPYTNIQNAIAAGYNTEVTGYRQHMGFYYINASLLDVEFEIDKPELLLYAL
ncbi:hypothetical protein [Adhaeribacter radiodurans]|uniref:Uncharacterized protein n=1 Tax=Adhaeribacter radiodurans TaxID=2745197 RepID=A0A7L7L6D5_9BACT|nr:hypothetical protein [Adhaeribacter radiodurans]QMU28368.1 hypothetical protein HUW48_10125 [Adhaeribacter radiodurans]